MIIGFNRKESDRLIQELGTAGILQIDRWDTAGIEAPAPVYSDLENTIASMLGSIEAAVAELTPDAARPSVPGAGAEGEPVIFSRDIEADRAAVETIRREMDELHELRQKYAAEQDELRERLSDARRIAALVGDPGHLKKMTLCQHAFGTLLKEINSPAGGIEDGFYLRQAGRFVLGICPAGKKDGLVALLRGYGFEEKEELLDSTAVSPRRLDEWKAHVELTKKDLDMKEEDLRGRMKDMISTLDSLHETYTRLGSAIEAKKGFLRTADTEFISGWIDFDDRAAIVAALTRVCGTRFFLHIFSEEEMRGLRVPGPVRLRNRWFFRAFEMIVKNAGIPESKELDPTPVATIAYLLMFGVMFGDVGQGLVLSATGLIMKAIARRKKLRGFFRDAGTILIAGGLSAALFGVLYGSVFSNEHLIPPLWFHPMEHIMDLFFAAIMMGASFISIGLLMNIFNLYKSGDYFETIFGIHGILGFIVYTGSLFLAVRYATAGTPPAALELLFILGLPICLFLFRNIPGHLFPGRKKLFPHGVFEYAVESIVELIEMFSGFLGNSISFIRAGAFALSHAGLSIAVYTLAGIVSPTLSAASLSIIVIGNIFIILLEGLVCGIQSMRLEYYEFFSKFFRGNGVEFTPFSFKRKQAVAKGVA